MVFLPELPASAGKDVLLPRRFVERLHGVLDRVCLGADVAERRTAAWRHRALHRAWIEEREPFMAEASGDFAFIAVAFEAPPVVIELVRPARHGGEGSIEAGAGKAAIALGLRD